MSASINIKERIDESISKVVFILSQKEDEETQDDFLIKYVIKIIFEEEGKIVFQNIPNESKMLLIKFVELLELLFQQKKEKREEIYLKNIDDIKENNLANIITDLDKLQNTDITISKGKTQTLYIIIMNSLIRKSYTIFVYI